jgi:predicted tellurium resistance membrane protein TerC
VNKHGTVKVLALAFLVMIGVALIMEGFGEHVNKAFIYFAMGFSVLVEFLNLRMTVNESRHWTMGHRLFFFRHVGRGCISTSKK